MGGFSDTVVGIGHGIVKRAAREQGGILSGENPSHFDSANPIRVWVIQLVIIIFMTQLLATILGRIKQPRVIAEVIGGVILGPTVMGRIPNFSKSIFPPESLPYLSLVATIGLVLFMFVIALELDVSVIEDLVSILFLPLYFTLSGLKTNLGLLNDGVTWGYTILIIVVAFFGKFIGCAATARFMGYNTRESGAIGMLMSCKGLVELIVLNVGLSAGILDTRTFSMFVVMAIVLTFVTSPLTILIYPERVRSHLGGHRAGADEGKKRRRAPTTDTTGHLSLMTHFTVVLNKVEHLPAVMTLTQFLQPPFPNTAVPKPHPSIDSSDEKEKTESPALDVPTLPNAAPPVLSDGTPRVNIDALRLIELTERTSAVMKVSASEELMQRDTLISVLRTFGHLNRIPVTSALSIVPRDSFASSVSSHAQETDADLVVIPWSSAPSAIDEHPNNATGITPQNPFDAIFGGRSAAVDKATSMFYSQFIRRVFVESPADVALFIDRGLSPLETSATYGQHIFLPFFGGPDDRLALAFVVQLCVHPAVSATVVRMKKTEGLVEAETRTTADIKPEQVAAALAANNTTASENVGDD
ncbi:K(+)/H(+) antiporter [Ceratobasidium sp. UAMH 11750]|nr:K(+)/H(+) antiporter [Ceratobasidium sp. UAMH 11750]